MPALKLPRPRPLARHSASISRWATVAAWFFIVFSLGSVAWALARQWADPGGTTALYGNAEHQAWGLTYSGIPGLLAAIVQLGVVGAAALLSTLPRSRFRRAANRILLGWAALWLVNLLWLASVDLRIDSFCQAALMTALFGCMVYRVLRRPRMRNASPAARDAAPDEPPLILVDNGVGTPGEAGPPPAPLSAIERVKTTARKIAAGPWKERAGAAAQRAQPMARSAFDATRRVFRRLQNG